MDISERKLQILQAIITDYVKSAEPVGSRSLAKKYGLGVSPATIRNEILYVFFVKYTSVYVHTKIDL